MSNAQLAFPLSSVEKCVLLVFLWLCFTNLCNKVKTLLEKTKTNTVSALSLKRSKF